MRNGIRASLIVFGAVGYMNEGRNARRFVPEMPFLNAVFFAEVVAVVACEDYYVELLRSRRGRFRDKVEG